jgi:hypothetical protein
MQRTDERLPEGTTVEAVLGKVFEMAIDHRRDVLIEPVLPKSGTIEEWRMLPAMVHALLHVLPLQAPVHVAFP